MFHKSKVRYGLSALLIIIVLLTIPYSAILADPYSQGGGKICYGWYSLDPDNENVVTGTISNNEPVHEWIFQGQAGTFATIRMETTDGTLDPFFYITDKTTGQRINSTSANDLAGRKIATSYNIALNSDGEYVINTTRLGEHSGTSAGSYKLSLEPGIAESVTSSDSFRNIFSVDQAARIYDGEIVRDDILFSNNLSHLWYFEGVRDHQVTIILRGIDGAQITQTKWGNINISIYLKGASEWKHHFYDSPRVENNELRIINLALPETATYVIHISSDYALGSYELALAGSGGMRPELPSCKAAPTQMLDLSTPPYEQLGIPQDSAILNNQPNLQGTITSEDYLHTYVFAAGAGDTLSISMSRVSGNLIPLMGVQDINGELLERVPADLAGRQSVATFIVPETGWYMLLVTRDEVEQGTTSGNYVVKFEGSSIGGTGAPPDLGVQADVINMNDLISGSITDEEFIHYYLIAGTTGQSIMFTLQRASGDLEPFIVLMDEDMKVMHRGKPDLAGRTSTMRINFLQDGWYIVAATRANAEQGTSTGNFSLQIEAE